MRFWKRVWNTIKNCCHKKPVRAVTVVPRPQDVADIIMPVHTVKKPTARDIRRRTRMYYEYYYRVMEIKKVSTVERVVTRIKNNRSRYMKAEKLTGIDWRVIGVIHELEAGGNFKRQLLNGELYTRRTRLVPKGEGPWKTWEESCVDAFQVHKLKDNSIGSVLKFLEKYNGLGYIKKGINSPYIWSYTTIYTSGKYVSDGRYNSYAVSKQVGAAPLLKLLNY